MRAETRNGAPGRHPVTPLRTQVSRVTQSIQPAFSDGNIDVSQAAAAAFGKLNPRLSSRSELRFGRRGSVAVKTDTGQWFDHERGEGGGLRSLLRQAGYRPSVTSLRPSPRSAPKRDRRPLAMRLWYEAQPAAGTLAERYLARRGISGVGLEALRFHRECRFGLEYHPAILALIVDPRSNEALAVHRRALLPDGSGAAMHWRSLGSVGSGVIKLSPDEDVTLGLYVGEGPETVLTMMTKGHSPAWCCVSAGGLRRFTLLPGVESITILADNDESGVGLRAAEDCRTRWHAAGREARIFLPKTKGDFNDLVRD